MQAQLRVGAVMRGGDNNWGENETTVSLTGLSATTTLGALIPGWGDLAWNNSEYGWGYSPVTIPQQQMGLTGISATSTLGTPTVTPETIALLTGSFCHFFSRIRYCRNWCTSHRTFNNFF